MTFKGDAYKTEQAAARKVTAPRIIDEGIEPSHLMQVGRGMMLVYRKVIRQRHINRLMTKKGYRKGVRI